MVCISVLSHDGTTKWPVYNELNHNFTARGAERETKGRISVHVEKEITMFE
jgi:hypothetical protein